MTRSRRTKGSACLRWSPGATPLRPMDTSQLGCPDDSGDRDSSRWRGDSYSNKVYRRPRQTLVGPSASAVTAEPPRLSWPPSCWTHNDILPHPAIPQTVDHRHSPLPAELAGDPSTRIGSRAAQGGVTSPIGQSPRPDRCAHLATGPSLEKGCVVPAVVTTTTCSETAITLTGAGVETDLSCFASRLCTSSAPTTLAGSWVLLLQGLRTVHGVRPRGKGSAPLHPTSARGRNLTLTQDSSSYGPRAHSPPEGALS